MKTTHEARTITVRRYSATCIFCGQQITADIPAEKFTHKREDGDAYELLTTTRVGLYCKPCDVFTNADSRNYTMEHVPA